MEKKLYKVHFTHYGSPIAKYVYYVAENEEKVRNAIENCFIHYIVEVSKGEGKVYVI